MPPENHERAWPDKIMFASMLLLFGSIVGLLFDAARLAGATIGGEGFVMMASLSPYYTIALELVGVTCGLVSLRFQSSRYLYLGAGAGIASMGFFLLVPLFAVLALAFVWKAYMEGEEIHHDDVTVPAESWPDKALAASLLLTLGGLTTMFHGVLVWAGRTDTWGYASTPVAATTMAAGLYVLWSARQCFHVRRPATAWVALLFVAAGGAFMVIGPLLAAATLLSLAMADKEQEFPEFSPD